MPIEAKPVFRQDVKFEDCGVKEEIIGWPNP